MDVHVITGLRADGTSNATTGEPDRFSNAPADVLARYVASANQLGREVGMRPEWCVAAARLGQRALPALGFRDVRTVGVQVGVQNAAAVDLAARGMSMDRWPPHAWSVGVQGTGISDGNGWDGHLVNIATDSRSGRRRRWLVDVTLDQVTRADRGLHVRPLVGQVADGFLRGDVTVLMTAEGNLLTYRRLRHLKGAVHIPRWTDEVLVPTLTKALVEVARTAPLSVPA